MILEIQSKENESTNDISKKKKKCCFRGKFYIKENVVPRIENEELVTPQSHDV